MVPIGYGRGPPVSVRARSHKRALALFQIAVHVAGTAPHLGGARDDSGRRSVEQHRPISRTVRGPCSAVSGRGILRRQPDPRAAGILAARHLRRARQGLLAGEIVTPVVPLPRSPSKIPIFSPDRSKHSPSSHALRDIRTSAWDRAASSRDAGESCFGRAQRATGRHRLRRPSIRFRDRRR